MLREQSGSIPAFLKKNVKYTDYIVVYSINGLVSKKLLTLRGYRLGN